MTKSEIRQQVNAMMANRSKVILKDIQNKVDDVQSKAFKNDEFLRSIHEDYYRAVEIAARCARELADKGLKPMRHVVYSPYVLDRCWKVVEVELCYFRETSMFYPGEIANNEYLVSAMGDYRSQLSKAAGEFDKVFEIIAELPANKAFDMLKEAGLPLVEKKVDKNLPATKLLLNLPEMLGGTNNG